MAGDSLKYVHLMWGGEWRGRCVQDLQGGPGSHHVYVYIWLGVWGFLLNSSPGAENVLLLCNLLLELS